jgi:hypothetical protein
MLQASGLHQASLRASYKSNNRVTLPIHCPALIGAILPTQNNHQTYENN